MGLKNDIVTEINVAMKSKDILTRDTLRVLKGDIERMEQGPKGKVEVSDSDIIHLTKKMIQGIKETTNNLGEIAILEKYLPKQLTKEEIETNLSNIISELGASGIKDMGKVMAAFKSKYDGMADGKLVSTIVKEKLG